MRERGCVCENEVRESHVVAALGCRGLHVVYTLALIQACTRAPLDGNQAGRVAELLGRGRARRNHSAAKVLRLLPVLVKGELTAQRSLDPHREKLHRGHSALSAPHQPASVCPGQLPAYIVFLVPGKGSAETESAAVSVPGKPRSVLSALASEHSAAPQRAVRPFHKAAWFRPPTFM